MSPDRKLLTADPRLLKRLIQCALSKLIEKRITNIHIFQGNNLLCTLYGL